MKYCILLILTCCLLCGCGPTTVNTLVQDRGAQKLSAKEVLALVNGNTLFLQTFNEDTTLYFDPSGQLFGKALSADKDKGKWDVSEGGELCFHMDKWWYGDLRCFQVYRDTNKNKLHLAGSNGVLQYAAEQQAGDSKQLYAIGNQQKKSLRRSIRTTGEDEPGAALSTTGSDTTTRPPSVIEEPRHSVEGKKDTNVTIEWMAKDCPGCNLAGADLGKAELIGARLAKADLHGANLSMANLRRADLQGANLREAILTYANLPGADLRGADLRGAVLKGANLIRADLSGAKLEGADLTEVLREGTKGLK
ncbi:MAG: pentapeptide repeat-containing protein [Desulfobulbaceae bacterium]|jgi:uncharacterized protein YjbI with pentapeptide repeats|nr:pentapeptide repeat-containing protein [Desulfobulbaceae bacterium]